MPATHYLTDGKQLCNTANVKLTTADLRAVTCKSCLATLGVLMPAPTPVPHEVEPIPEQIIDVRLANAAFFPGRGSLLVLVAALTRNLGTDTGGFDFTLHGRGVLVKDSKQGSTTLIPWSNVVSVGLANE